MGPEGWMGRKRSKRVVGVPVVMAGGRMVV